MLAVGPLAPARPHCRSGNESGACKVRQTGCGQLLDSSSAAFHGGIPNPLRVRGHRKTLQGLALVPRRPLGLGQGTRRRASHGGRDDLWQRVGATRAHGSIASLRGLSKPHLQTQSSFREVL